MIIRGITLDNFGLYKGVTHFDLVPRRTKGAETPIILIGGKNGAGKTTLLEAVRLALYGRLSLGSRVAQSDYDAYLRNMHHRGDLSEISSVGLEFDYAEAGSVHRYNVKREWTTHGKSVSESLTVEKDGSPISSVPREEWHHFLQELIPPGVSQLFFFDGEKIREIADADQQYEELADAIRGLLGVDLVSRLRTDIGLYLARHHAEKGNDGERLEQLLRDIKDGERKAGGLSEQVAELTSARDSQARAAEQIRRRFVAEGGDAAAQRQRIELERETMVKKREAIEHELRSLAVGMLPFAVAPRLLKNFRKALEHAKATTDRRGAAAEVRSAIAEWRRVKQSDRKASWNAKHWNDLTAFLNDWMKSQAATQPARRPLKEIGDGRATLARLSELKSIVVPRARRLATELDGVLHRLTRLETSLVRADGAAAGVLLDELRLADQKVGSTEAKLQEKGDELKLIRGQLVTLDRERRKLLNEQASAVASVQRSEIAARTATALETYERKLLEHKISQLRTEFVRRFNMLTRKAEFVSDILIDPETFGVTLISPDGTPIPKSSLSAGEKQIFAIAMLWALARTSRRPLPMIIDTPLARLDSEHRSNLIERYFPAASHQFILLSTDTEVDLKLLETLGSSVSHAYRLDYDAETRSTTASRGYFGDNDGRKARRALQ
jgi:DNA sulfur modification protein DndD